MRLTDHIKELVINDLQEAAAPITRKVSFKDFKMLILPRMKFEKPLLLLSAKHTDRLAKMFNRDEVNKNDG